MSNMIASRQTPGEKIESVLTHCDNITRLFFLHKMKSRLCLRPPSIAVSFFYSSLKLKCIFVIWHSQWRPWNKTLQFLCCNSLLTKTDLLSSTISVTAYTYILHINNPQVMYIINNGRLGFELNSAAWVIYLDNFTIFSSINKCWSNPS